MCCWNVAGVRDKMNNQEILSFVLNFHIVWLLEIKTTAKINVPGFHTFQNSSIYCGNRGGVAMLVKYSLLDFIKFVNMNSEGQIWVELSCYPGFVFGGVYIPPSDSPYFVPTCFGNLGAVMNEHENVVALGDFNSRVGIPLLCNENFVPYTYSGVIDLYINGSGRQLLNMCQSNNMVIGNHLVYGEHTFGGGLSFRRGSNWVSEIDLCITSEKVLNHLKCVEISQNILGSDHAPMMVRLNLTSVRNMPISLLTERATDLGRSYFDSNCRNHSYMVRGLACKYVDMNRFKIEIERAMPPNLDVINIETVCTGLESATRIINRVAKDCKLPNRREHGQNEWDQNHPRWKRIFERDDTKIIWKSIDWKGNVMNNDNDNQPDDVHFRLHFERLFNPDPTYANNIQSVDISLSPYIPILDDPFTYQEIDMTVKSMNKGKSYVGVCPGIFSLLPMNWMTFFLVIFNFLFCNFVYPFVWCHDRLVTLFKSGNRMDCGNYRGISIMNTFAKIYDALIVRRLNIWAGIDKCQAGAQKGRGCSEQILALRLIMDYALFKKEKLYVVFVDFSKAYDRVPRDKLIECLKEKGCGKNMLMAIHKIYTCTKSVLKSVMITSTVGIRQGAPTSCLLFVIYLDKMVKMIREGIGRDGFLGTMHTLLLMDDTVILSTSREKCLEKVGIMMSYCNSYGMVVNEKKTKFFVVNGNGRDRESLITNNIKIDYCEKYLYLGAWFISDGKMQSVLKQHEIETTKSINKFSIFCYNNATMPYAYKTKVFKAALGASLLYSAESWLTNNVTSMERIYNQAVRCLLGVRNNTPMTLCLVESGLESFIHEVKIRRKRFLEKKLAITDTEEPFHYIYDICRRANTPGYRFLDSCLSDEITESSLVQMRNEIRNKPETATKYHTYREVLNTSLQTHKIYSENVYVPDYMRTAFTRLRIMSHDLRIETGRWSRTPRELRVCNCDSETVQSELHVLIDCPKSRSMRLKFRNLNFANVDSLFEEEVHLIDLCQYIFEVLKLYDR